MFALEPVAMLELSSASARTWLVTANLRHLDDQIRSRSVLDAESCVHHYEGPSVPSPRFDEAGSVLPHCYFCRVIAALRWLCNVRRNYDTRTLSANMILR
jgi:hypothetical protein